MAKQRRARIPLKEDRQLIQMAAAAVTLGEAAATRRNSVETVEKTTKRLGIQVRTQ